MSHTKSGVIGEQQLKWVWSGSK